MVSLESTRDVNISSAWSKRGALSTSSEPRLKHARTEMKTEMADEVRIQDIDVPLAAPTTAIGQFSLNARHAYKSMYASLRETEIKTEMSHRLHNPGHFCSISSTHHSNWRTSGI